MPYQRFIHYGPSPGELTGTLHDRALVGCWFELRRWGGCGAGELRLGHRFPERDAIQIGDWVSLEYEDGDRWYLGRVTDRQSDSPAGVLLKLEGMSSLLDFVFPGGYGSEADGVAPHRYGCTEHFPADPDAAHQNIDCVSRPVDLVRRLLDQYIVPATGIMVDDDLIEDATAATELAELKVRGTESATALLNDLALRARNASWGVDEQGRFYLLQRKDAVAAEWQEARDLISLREIENERYLFNRVLLTGGYVYADCGSPPCGTYRWQGNYLQPLSRAQYGEHRIRLSIPWIRTSADSQAFVREFFRVYSQPTPHYRVEVARQETLVRPWLASVRVLDQSGTVLATAQPEVIRVEFDRTPKFRVELGPLNPKTLWPAGNTGDAWPIAPSDVSGFGGGPIDVTSDATLSSSSDESGSETTTDDLTDCYGCAAMPRRWSVTFSGLTPGWCDECDLINGTYVLEHDPAFSYCRWSAQHPACGGPSPSHSIHLIRLPDFTRLVIIVNGLYAVQYVPAGGVFHCHAPNNFDLYAQNAICNTPPATVVVEPA